jgi:hypothetical protein
MNAWSFNLKLKKMKIKNKVLLSVEESDLINGHFENLEVEEISDKCLSELKGLKSVYLPAVKKIGDDCLSSNTALTTVSLPAATTIGNDCLHHNTALTTVSLPAATTIGNDCLRSNTALTTVSLPAATTFGDYCLSYNAALTTISLPAATTFGNNCLSSNTALTTVSLPAATTFGNNCLRYNAALTTVSLPAATTIGNNCLSYNTALTTISLPAATTFGDDCLRYNAALTTVSLPAATTFGDDCLRYNAALTTVILREKEYSVKSIDGYCFVVELSKTSKGILIHTGYNILSMNDGILLKQNCYVAEKENYYAHGETIKKAISDLQFKLVCEKLKKDPINADTLITINHYRVITGACEFGVRSWMQQNQISVDEIKASELLPILEKTGAYGFENFKKLLTF